MSNSVLKFPSAFFGGMRPEREKVNDDGAFSLLEMLIVLTIAGLLAALAAPSLLTIKSTSLSAAAGEFGGFLKLCRTKAIAERTSVRLAIATSSAVPEEAYRKYAGWKWDKATEDYAQFSAWKFLPADSEFENRIPDYVLASSYAKAESSVVKGDYLLTDEFQNKEAGESSTGEKFKIQYLTFSPSGRAYVEGGEERNLIFVLRESIYSPQQPITNWYQFTVDTLTGRARIYQP